MAADNVSLPDLEVIQRFSLAVRAATAPRAEVIAALESDLAHLRASVPVHAGTPRPEPTSAPATPKLAKAAPSPAEAAPSPAKATRRTAKVSRQRKA